MKKAPLLALVVHLAGAAFAQTGTEFWVAPPDVTYLHNTPGDQPIYLNVTTGAAPATVTISQPANAAFNGGAPIVLNLAASTAMRYDLTALKTQLETRPTNTVCNTGLRIQATADITCYYEVSNTNNPDIIALKGANGLGREFYIPLHKYAPFHNHDFASTVDPAFASFDIVATQNNTAVMIYSPVAVDGHPALTPFTIYLGRGQTYSCANTSPANYTDPATHPSGAVVLADKPVAISLKDDSDHNPSGGCYDLMLDQIVPVNILGTEYVAVKGQLNPTGDESVFIMAVENNTQVFTNGGPTPIATLFAGQSYRLDMDYLAGAADNSVYVTTSKPAYATHVTGFGCEMGMASLPPLNCAGSRQVSFTRSTNEAFYLNLLVRSGSEDDFVVTGAGTATITAASFLPVPGTGGAWRAARIPFDLTQVPVNQAFIVTNTTDVFSLGLINGGATTGCRYGFFSEFAGDIVTNAGPDQARCASDVVHLNGSVSGGSTTGLWTSTGSGTFQPSDTDLHATYVPSVGDQALGSVTLTLTSTGNCTPESDAMTVTFQALPIPEAGPDQQVCANSPVVTLAGSMLHAIGGVWTGGAGTFLPSNASLNATYTPTPAEVAAGVKKLYLTSNGNGVCPAVTDSLRIVFTPSPTVNAGADRTLCANNANVILNAAITVASGVQWSGGTGLYTPGSTAQNITYSPSPVEVANGSVLLTATTTGNGNCGAVADQVLLVYTLPPTANAGPDASVSANNADVALNGSVTVSSGGQWSGGLGTFAPNSTDLHAVYSPTAAEIAAGSLVLHLTTTGNGTCAPVTDDVTITFTAAPTVDAGPDRTVCANNASVALNGSVTVATGGIWSGGGGTFTPNNTTLNATYTLSAAEIAAGQVTLTLTSIGNGNSNPVSDQVAIVVTPSPTANAGPDIQVCANQADAQLVGAVGQAAGGVWSGGAGSFDPTNTNMNAIYTPSLAEVAAGSVTLTLTTTGNGTCTAVQDQVLIRIAGAPTVDAGPGGTACANNPNLPLAGTVSGAGGGIWSGGTGVFNPSVTAMNAVYTPSTTEIANGSVTLTLTSTANGTCAPVSDPVLLVYSLPPSVNAGADITVCQNAPTASLSGTVAVAGGGHWSGGTGLFSPDANTLNATYTPSPAEIALGSVTLTLTSTQNGTCNPVSDAVTITIVHAPVANAGNALFICSNNAQVQLGGSVSGAGGGQWSGGAGSFTPSIAALNAIYQPTAAEVAAGHVTLTLTTIGNGVCNAVASSVPITFTPPPTAEAGTGTVLCANNASIHLGGSVTVANGGAWSGAQGTFTPNSNALNAVYAPSQGEIAAGFVTLTLTTTGNNGCSAVTDQVTYTFSPAPTAQAGADASTCASGAAVHLAGAVTVASGGLWSGGAGTFTPGNNSLSTTYTPTAAEIAAGTVTLTLTTVGNGTCNAVSDAMLLTIDPVPVVNAGPDRSICRNDPAFQLSGFVGHASGGIWSGGAGIYLPGNTALSTHYTPTAAELTAGSITFTLTSTGTTTCPAVADQVTIVFTDAPVVDAGPDQLICANAPMVQLMGQVANATGGTWSGGAGTFSPSNTVFSPTYLPTAAEIAAGSLTLTLTSTGNGNCLATQDALTITFTAAPTANAGPDISICANNPVVPLNGAVTVAGGGLWSGGAGSYAPGASALNASYTPTPFELQAGAFTLTLTTTGQGNCAAMTDDVNVTVMPAPVADAGPDITTCASDLDVVLSGAVQGMTTTGLWSTSGTGTFLPSPATLNATYRASTLDSLAGSVVLTLSSTGNGLCNAVTDALTLTILPSAVANAGPDVTLCATQATIALHGTITGNATQGTWSSTGAGTFGPNASAPDAVYTLAPSDALLPAITFTWSVNSCDHATDQLVATIVPASHVFAGPDRVTCVDDLDVLINGVVDGASSTGVWTTTGTGTFMNPASALSNFYQASAADSVAQGVDLLLTATNTGVCPADVDTMHVSIRPYGTVNAGADLTFCANNVDAVLGGSVIGDATQVHWSTSGTGTFFPSAAVLDPTYLPSAVDTAIGSLTLTLTAVNSCNSASDALTLTLTPPPYVNAGPDQTYCSLVTQFTLSGTVSGVTHVGHWTTTGTGVIANAGALNTTYTASPADIAAGRIDLFLTSLNNGDCAPVTDRMTIWLTSAIVADAGPDQSVCLLADHAQLMGTVMNGPPSGVWTTSGTGTFSPAPDVLNAQYLFTPADVANGSVELTFTATNTGNCVAVHDALTLTFGHASYAYAGEDSRVCANDPIAALSGNASGALGSVWSSSGSGFFSNTTDPHATYTLSPGDLAAGAVELTLTTITDGTCSAASDAVTIAVQALPVVHAGADRTLCTAAPVQLMASATSAAGSQWTTTGTGTFLDPTALITLYYPSPADSAAGSVTLTVMTTGTAPCTAVSDALVLRFGGGLSADAGPDVAACSTDPQVALHATLTGTQTGVWTTSGTGSFSPSATALDATYVPGLADFVIGDIRLIVTTTNNQGCPAGADTLTVHYQVPPTVNAGPSVVLCDGLAAVHLDAVVQHEASLQWTTTGSGTFAPDAGVPNAVYTPSINDSLVGGVHLILTAFGQGVCGNGMDSLFVGIGPTRIADAGADVQGCATGDPVQLAGSITGVSGGVWSTNGTGTFLPNAQDPDATYLPSTTDLVFPQLRFILTTTGNQGCPADADTMTLFLHAPPTADAGADVSTCEALQAIPLHGASTHATSAHWTTTGTGSFVPDANTLAATYLPAATDSLAMQVQLVLTTTGAGVCPAATDTLLISFVDPLHPAFSASTACVGAPTTLTDESTVDNGSIIAWNWHLGTGATASGDAVSTTYPAAGPYTVTLTVIAQNGCSATVTRTVDVLERPTAGFSISGDPLSGEPIAFTDTSSGATAWHYDFGDDLGASIDRDPTYDFPGTGQFIVVQTVTNAAGCTDQDSLLIVIGTDVILPPKLPNAFTPNGDGVNDVFYVRGGPFRTMDLTIYNGWGEAIFHSTDPLFGWDGTYKGVAEINGVYTYTVRATTMDGVEHDRPGKVNLIR